MNHIEVRPGLTMAYEDHWFGEPWTTPETIVMLHGNAESSRAWITWVPHLSRHFRVLRPDLPGFGASSAPDGYGWSVTELAADIDRYLDALKIAKCHLLGAKYGGSVAMQLAIDQPERFLSLGLFGSPVRGSGGGNADKIRDLGVRRWADATQRTRLGSAAGEAQIAWWTDELMARTDPRAAFGASSARIDMDLEDRLGGIACPTLIVTTQESGLQTVETVNRYAARIPDARVIVLPGDSYHIAAAAPDVCATEALRFLQEISGRRK
ncbi:MAG: alpha/beta fold hydrolase [Bradyrhizobiaceae bacterium]|nr:alpha/beta fold hydrolase [Bradyrhizobiaceae bacterium]